MVSESVVNFATVDVSLFSGVRFKEDSLRLSFSSGNPNTNLPYISFF